MYFIKSIPTREPSRPMDLTDYIMAWEAGNLSPRKTVEFFSKILKEGTVWHLQGMYGRFAANLIQAGYIDGEGNILKMPED